MSHGDQQSKVAVIQAIRALEEKRFERPTTILADLQGPKLRVGKLQGRQGRSSPMAAPSCSTVTPRRATPPASSCRTVRSSRRSSPARGCCSMTVSSCCASPIMMPRPDRVQRSRSAVRCEQQQGPQRSRRRAADGRTDREGPQRSLLGDRAGRRLDRACRSSSAPRTWPRRGKLIGGKAALARQDREACRRSTGSRKSSRCATA